MKKQQFYLTLPSTSSNQYFPENTSTRFSTQLPRNIQLSGEWLVALVEFQFPCTFLTVSEVGDISMIINENEHQSEKLLNGYYETVEDFVTVLNKSEILKSKVAFNYSKTSKRVSVEIKDFSHTSTRANPIEVIHARASANKINKLSLPETVSLQLGFKPGTNLATVRQAPHMSNILLGIPSQLFIYCDIVEQQFVGDVVAPLLRIVNVETKNYTFGSQKMQIFSSPHYMPVLRREFQNLEIDIRTNTGSPAPFQFGTVVVKLHFIKVDSS